MANEAAGPVPTLNGTRTVRVFRSLFQRFVAFRRFSAASQAVFGRSLFSENRVTCSGLLWRPMPAEMVASFQALAVSPQTVCCCLLFLGQSSSGFIDLVERPDLTWELSTMRLHLSGKE